MRTVGGKTMAIITAVNLSRTFQDISVNQLDFNDNFQILDSDFFFGSLPEALYFFYSAFLFL